MNKNKIAISSIVASLLILGLITALCLFIFVKIMWILVVVLIAIGVVEVFFVIRILLSPRSSYAKASWSFIILFFPVIGFLVFVIFGVYPLKRRQRETYLSQLKDFIKFEDFSLNEKVKNDQDFSEIFNYGLNQQSKPVYKNNDIKIISDNTQLFEESIKLIRSAKQYINIQSYIFSYNGFWSKVLFTELIKKANSGVKVRLIYDWVGIHNRVDIKTFEELEKYGIEVASFNPKGFTKFKGATNYRLHSKFIIIDNKVALYGGSNFADEYLSMDLNNCHWRDLNYLITGPIVTSLNVTFINYWTVFCETKNKLSKQNLLNDTKMIFEKNDFDENDMYTQLLVFEPDFNEYALQNVLLNNFYRAKKSIKILTPYFCPPNSIIKALQNCHSRGIKIELIAHNKNQKYVQMLNRENYEKLAKAGCDIYEYDGYLHCKCIIIDDKYVLTGSCNIDWRSIYLDFESELTIYNEKFTKSILDIFEEIKLNSTLQTYNMLLEKNKIWNRFLLKLLNTGKSLF